MGEYNKNDNLHNITSAGTVYLHVIKGERTAGLLSNDLSRIVDVRCPDDSQTGVQRTKQFRRRHNASCDCCRFRT